MDFVVYFNVVGYKLKFARAMFSGDDMLESGVLDL